MPKISTGIGDKGCTRICGEDSVKKTDSRVDAFGSIDELSSVLGLIASKEKDLKKVMTEIQTDLYKIGSEIQTNKQHINTEHIKKLEDMENELENELPELKRFILPGGSEIASLLHIARTICRRAERNVVNVTDKHKINKDVLIYLNRLSDLLFLIARKKNIDNGIDDEQLGV